MFHKVLNMHLNVIVAPSREFQCTSKKIFFLRLEQYLILMTIIFIRLQYTFLLQKFKVFIELAISSNLYDYNTRPL